MFLKSNVISEPEILSTLVSCEYEYDIYQSCQRFDTKVSKMIKYLGNCFNVKSVSKKRLHICYCTQ
jgi:hypothetical protein